ncbi:MAG: Zinc protease [Labilithrix sp.]|nr:Zinc protease [Labilithrix sp.]
MRSRAWVAALACVLAACGGGKTYRAPRSLEDYRPPQGDELRATPLADDAEAFRAEPPPWLPRAERSPETPIETRVGRGVRLVMLPRHDFPTVTAAFVLERGASAGAPAAAALYAMSLTGTSAAYGHDEGRKYLRLVGADTRADVTHDAVTFELTALAPLFVSALSRAAPMFISPALDGAELEGRRAAGAAWRGRVEELPSEIARETLEHAVFAPPHPYSVPVFGRSPRRSGKRTRSDLEATTDAQVRAFRDSALVASNVSVVVVGDFEPAAMQRIVERSVAGLPAGPAAPPPRATAVETPARTGSVRRVIFVDRPGAAQSTLAVGWPGPRAGAPEQVALEVLASAATGSLSSRLNVTLRSELGATYGVRFDVDARREGGLLRITTGVDSAQTADALKRLFAELERLRTTPLSDAELAAARLRAYASAAGTTAQGLAMRLASAVAAGLPASHAVAHDARVDLVTAEDVRAAAERSIAEAGATVVVVGDRKALGADFAGLGLGEVTVVPAP